MSRKILISLGSLSILGAAACALSFLDLNFAKAIEEEEEYREFSLNTEEQPNPNIPKEPLEEETHLQEEEIQNDVPEEEQVETLSQPTEEENEELSPIVETPSEVPEESLSTKELEEEKDATSVNETSLPPTPQETEPTTNLKNQQPEEEKKITKPEQPEIVTKESTPPVTKTPEVPPKSQKPEKSENNQTDSSNKGKSISSTSGKQSSVKELWTGNRNNKTAEPGQGIKSTNLIRDYSFKLMNSCISGTIWILDYEIPEDDKYPTKFFFGTSAQVAAKISFNAQENTYQQVLPTNSSSCTKTRILGETDINYGGADHYRKYKWNTNEHGVLNIAAKDNNNVINWLGNTHKPPYFYYDVSSVRLAYVATDFLKTTNKKTKKKTSDSHIADFAVIEIDFQQEEIAKRMTRDFHTKHHHKNASYYKPINFFSKPLLETKTNEQLYQESIDIYIAGYSSNGLKGRSMGSFDLDKQQASKLTFSNAHKMINTGTEDIIGHADASNSKNPIQGYNTGRTLKGLELVIEHDSLEEGSLGSLVTDAEGNAIGVKSRYEKDKPSTVTPFRSKEIKKNKSQTIIPSYDLITGSTNSYKSSILGANKQTYLSKKQGWSNKK